MKTWTPSHVRLVTAVIRARAALRDLLPALQPAHRLVVGNALATLGTALKARGDRTQRRKAEL